MKVCNIDVERRERCGIPEIVFGEKQINDLIKIIKKILKHNEKVIITRIDEKKKNEILDKLKNIKINNNGELKFRYNKRGRVLVIKKNSEKKEAYVGKIGILTAGTSDIEVAEEAKEVAVELGCDVITEYDVGIAGLHRTIKAFEKFKKNDVRCIIAVAGMEGALPSVISGLTDIPVIGVPTSVGYGTGEKGLASVMTMLNSCTSVAVVNIDNGTGAAIIAYKILRMINKDKQ